MEYTIYRILFFSNRKLFDFGTKYNLCLDIIFCVYEENDRVVLIYKHHQRLGS